MNLTRKDIIIIILSFCLLSSSGVNIFLSYQSSYIIIDVPDLETLIVGTDSGPHDLDPTDCWDSDSRDVIEQVVETLFTYDTRQYVVDETIPRINWLATGYSWDVTNTILTVDIRTGVYFHDGTLMDANAVAWSFNRFLYLMNHTGELPSDGRAVKVHSLYEFSYFRHGTPIFDTIAAADADTVVFTLNAPFAPILDAMCYISCGILSPSSTPSNKIIDLATGDIVGTGPYTYDYYITEKEVRFSKFDDYWGTPLMEDEVMFDVMVYSVIDDPSALNHALITGDIDVLLEPMTGLLPTFRTNPWITVYEADNPGLVYQYLCFNNHQINRTWRKAMSYAFNYSYIIEVMLEGRAYRAYSAISPSYGAGFNHWLRDSDRSIDPTNGSAIYNLTIARQTILDELGDDARLDPRLEANDTTDDPLWLAADLATYNYSYNTGDWFTTDLYPLLEDWYDDIGITLLEGGTDWGYYLLRAYGYIPGGYDQLQVFFSSEEFLYLGRYRWWSYGLPPTTGHSDYLDPFNMLESLFSNSSVSNACQVNDPRLQGNLSLALQTTDDTTRNQIYHDIQWRLFAELYVHAPVYHTFITTVHSADLYDIEYDVMGRWWALPVKRNFTWVPKI